MPIISFHTEDRPEPKPSELILTLSHGPTTFAGFKSSPLMILAQHQQCRAYRGSSMYVIEVVNPVSECHHVLPIQQFPAIAYHVYSTEASSSMIHHNTWFYKQMKHLAHEKGMKVKPLVISSYKTKQTAYVNIEIS